MVRHKHSVHRKLVILYRTRQGFLRIKLKLRIQSMRKSENPLGLFACTILDPLSSLKKFRLNNRNKNICRYLLSSPP